MHLVYMFVRTYVLPSSPVVNENVSLVISRQLLTDFCTHLPNLPDSTAKAVYHFTLEKIQPRVISFEEQVGYVQRTILCHNVRQFIMIIISYQIAQTHNKYFCRWLPLDSIQPQYMRRKKIGEMLHRCQWVYLQRLDKSKLCFINQNSALAFALASKMYTLVPFSCMLYLSAILFCDFQTV